MTTIVSMTSLTIWSGQNMRVIKTGEIVMKIALPPQPAHDEKIT